jgi:hypothetical protein
VCFRLGPFEITSNKCSTQPSKPAAIQETRSGTVCNLKFQLSQLGMISGADCWCIVLTVREKNSKDTMCTQEFGQWTTCGTLVEIGNVQVCANKGKKDKNGKVICDGQPKSEVTKYFTGICRDCK